MLPQKKSITLAKAAMVVLQQPNPNLNHLGPSLYVQLGNIPNQVIYGYVPN